MTSRKLLTDSEDPDAHAVDETEPEQETDPYQELWARDLSVADLLIPAVIVALLLGWELVRDPAPPMPAEAAIVRQAPSPPVRLLPAPVQCDGDPHFDRTC